MNQKSRSTAVILAFLLGCWGIHCFYVGKKVKGFILLVLGIIGLFAYVPLFITGVIALIDFIKYLVMNDAEFQTYCENNYGVSHKSPSYSAPNRRDEYDNTLEDNTDTQKMDYSFCTECGAKMVKGTNFCPVCGAKQ